jgi:hypothetical protein
MKHRALIVVFIGIMICFLSITTFSQTPAASRVTGVLHLGQIPLTFSPAGIYLPSVPMPGELECWLRLDEPAYVAQGSKSEASTDIAELRVPPELHDQTKLLDGQQVAITGIMECSGYWYEGAHCKMLVKQIDKL